jgi:uncharacterized protein (UPF0264 family)
MTRLLVSVRSADEALSALAGGAEIIDVKEPSGGSLGRADETVWRDVVEAMKVRPVPISVALGELLDPSPAINYPPGIRFAKIGLAHALSIDWRDRWSAWLRSLPSGLEAVAVAYVDQDSGSPPPEEILEFAAARGIRTLLLDTLDKSRGCLFDHCSFVWLRKFCLQVKEANLALALAGSLQKEHFPAALAIGPDIIAVRSAACIDGREGKVSASLVRVLCEIMGKTLSPA